MSCLTSKHISDLSHISAYVEEGEQQVCGCMAVKNYPKKKGRKRREEGEGTKHGDGEIGIEKCIRVRVLFLCVCVQGYVHVDV